MKFFKEDAGVVIAEAAMILPVFIFVGIGIMDMLFMIKQSANVDYVAIEVSRCEALREMTPIAPLPCNPSNNGVSPHQYAVNLAQAMRLTSGNLTISTPNCDPNAGICRVDISYGYKPVGVWFPAINISRTGIASYTQPVSP